MAGGLRYETAFAVQDCTVPKCRKSTGSIKRGRRLTQVDGCRTCRSRKVKCDENRPKCGQCIKSHLDCGGFNSWAIDLSVSRDTENESPRRTERRPKQADGQACGPFTHTLRSCLSMSPADVVAARLMESSSSDRSWASNSWWLGYVVVHLDRCLALQQATNAVTSQLCGQRSATSGVKDYVQSIEGMKNTNLMSDVAILTALMLASFELHRNVSQSAFDAHIGGIVSILLSNPDKWAASETGRCALYLLHQPVFLASIKADIASPFDHPLWLSVMPPTVGHADTRRLRHAAHCHWIKLPRAISRFRNLKYAQGVLDSDQLHGLISLVHHEILEEDAVTDEFSVMSRAFKLEAFNEGGDRSNNTFAYGFSYTYGFHDLDDWEAIRDYSMIRVQALNFYHQLIVLAREAGVTNLNVWSPSQRSAERYRLVTRLITTWHFGRSRGLFVHRLSDAGFSVVRDFLEQEDWHFRNISPEQLRAWDQKRTSPSWRWLTFRWPESTEQLSKWWKCA